ncbi:MAG: hypothetical protein KAI57_03860 [Candidatus Pacebacteria bacterium]|nr:hypothetical protein [Candidatus Paceibacterota bacterium]
MSDKDKGTKETVYKITINARSKAHLVYIIKKKSPAKSSLDEKKEEITSLDKKTTVDDTEEETVEVKIEVITTPSTKIPEGHDGLIVNLPIKTIILLSDPSPLIAKKIADQLNQLEEVKGLSLWSPDQEGLQVCILGNIEEEKAETTIKSTAISIVTNFMG